ncbi:phage tail fiber domain-containing protein [Endozoicomonas ascidiicola]|uniref:phage tail fiber domain-containing protein n=1 Tax=Endozoicomonas ascidiicola TaxID=1698521 RepID=UPI0008329E46|nr:phage tail fiber protein [Endozoicomonas ascidiicola]
MALSRVQYEQLVTGNKNFSVTMPYISKDDIKVSVAGEPVTYSWLNPQTVQLTAAPDVGQIIDVQRETERTKLLVDFQDASTITETQLDLATRQAVYLAQEAFDLTNSTMAVANDGSYSASNRRISVLGEPDSDDDAATAGWVKGQFNSGYDAHEERVLAEQAAGSAGLSESSAADSESNAATSESRAKTSETNAAVSESNAKTSEINAGQLADTAANHEANAQAYAASINLPLAPGNDGKVLITDGTNWIFSSMTLASLVQRLTDLESKTANISISGSTTLFSGEIQAADLSIGN